MASSDDVLIVGAGPAGASAALVLARAGVRVRLVDRARFPRPKLCGDTLNPGAIAVLGRLGVAEEVRAASIRLEGMTVTGPGGASVTARYGGLSGAAISRKDLDLLLLRRAVAAGADFEESVNVLGPLLSDDDESSGTSPRVRGVSALTASGQRVEITARVTIAADGWRSRLAFGLGLARHPPTPRRWAIGTYFEGVSGVGPLGEMHVRPGHYLGIAPLPGGLANVCLVVPQDTARRAGRHPMVLLEQTTAADALLRERFRGARALSPPTVLGPLAVEASCAGLPGLLLAGDAAGFVDPMTGDGARFALRGGELAAAAAAHGLEHGGGEERLLARLVAAEFNEKRRFNRALRLLVGWPPAVRAAAAGGSLLPAVVRWVVRYAGDLKVSGVTRSTIPPAGAPAA